MNGTKLPSYGREEEQQNLYAAGPAIHGLRAAERTGVHIDEGALWMNERVRSRLLEAIGEVTVADLLDAGNA